MTFRCLVAGGTLLPVLLASLAVWRRCWKAGAAEVALAAGVTTPLLLIVAVAGVGTIPVHRPLDHFAWVQLTLSLAAGVAAVRLRRELPGWWRDVRDAGRALRRRSGLAVVALSIGAGGQLAALLYGHWEAPRSFDELSYHLPQALQLLQDGRVGRVQTAVIWGDSYPRAAAFLYFWTIRLTGTDAGVHPVNAAFGVLLMIAAYVAARRMGIDRAWSAVSAGIAPTAPIVFQLSVVGYIDLPVGALIAAGAAAALPRRMGESVREEAPGLVLCGAALLAAMWMKATAVPLAALVASYLVIASVAARARRGRAQDRVQGPGPLAIALGAILVFALASIPYVQTYLEYGSPTYPQRFELRPLAVFDGPMMPGAYLPQEFHSLSKLQKYVRFWTDWLRWPEVDSPGGFGPLFTLVMLPGAMCAVFWLRARERGWVLLVAMFWAVLVLPLHFVPRYAVWIVMPGAVFAARIGSALSNAGRDGPLLGRSWLAMLIALELFNSYLTFRCFREVVRGWVGMNMPLFTRHRTRVVQDVTQRDIPHGPTPATRVRLYELMRDGETLVSIVREHHTLLHDPDYRYRVEHRPARSWGFYWPEPGDPEWGEEEVPAWLEGLRRDGVAAVMLYAGSPEDRALAAPGSGYAAVYEQPPEDGPVIRIYRAAEGPGATRAGGPG